VQLELEGGHEPEIAPAPTQSPEKLGVLLGARHEELTVSGDDIAGQQIVDR
jgi:hypothetical protein